LLKAKYRRNLQWFRTSISLDKGRGEGKRLLHCCSIVCITHRRSYNGAKSISVFGSYAKENQTDESDLDLLVEFTTTISLLKLIALENYLSDLLFLKVDLVPKNNIREELQESIVKEALSM
jgi:uncharacterized protein